MPTNTSTASTINDTLRPTRVLPARPRATAVVLAFLLVVLAALFPVIAADSLNNDGNAILATASPTAIALTSTTTAPGDHSDFNPAGGFRAIASNISSTGMRSLCPADYRARNGYCWRR